MKNLCAKTVSVNAPYEIWMDYRMQFEYRVLKKWQADDNKIGGRWFCATKSPFTHGGYEMGDASPNEVRQGSVKLTEAEMQEHLAKPENQWKEYR